MYYIAICDDHQEFVQYMRRLVESCMQGEGVTFYEYNSGEELIADMGQRKHLDLLLLDMQLKEMNGNETAKAFRIHFPSSMLVFCSGMYEPTVESFEVTPYRYLLKRYTEEHMTQELEAIVQKMKENQVKTYITGEKDGSEMKVDIKNIWYIEHSGRKRILHCYSAKQEEIYTSPMKLKEFYEQLEAYGFAYANRNELVNIQHVTMVGDREVELDNGEKLSLSRTKEKEFQKVFAYNLAQKYER